MYVLNKSWKREWIVLLLPPSPEPERCQQILNDPSKRGSREWCICLRQFDQEAWRNTSECQPESCYRVTVDICCSGTSSKDCATLSGGGGLECIRIPEGTTAEISVSWSISWSARQGWTLYDIGKKGAGECKPKSFTGKAPSGERLRDLHGYCGVRQIGTMLTLMVIFTQQKA